MCFQDWEEHCDCFAAAYAVAIPTEAFELKNFVFNDCNNWSGM